MRFRSLEGREFGGQLSKDALEWKVSKRLLEKKHQKKKIMRNKEGTSHQSGWHSMGSSTRGSKREELVVPRNPSMTLWKGEATNNEGSFSNSESKQNHWENFVKKFKESSKRKRNIVWYPKTTTIEHTWIQRDSNFASLRGLENHLSL